MVFQTAVSLKYQIYNSLFLNLPFRGIESTGTHLALFAQECRDGLQARKSPAEIIGTFMEEYYDELDSAAHLEILFQFIQYAERQVVLFDAAEDAAFSDTHDLEGKGSVKHLLARLDSEADRRKLLKKLSDFCVRIVLTAHPTQFYPGKVLGICNDLGAAIRTGDVESIGMLLLQLGKTPIVNRKKPIPEDEAVSLGWYLENVFYEALSDVVFQLLKDLGQSPHDFPSPRLLALGFWPGGDRDGNPFVTSETTKTVARRLREGILRRYYADIRVLKRRLSFRGTEELVAEVEQKIQSTLYAPHKSKYDSCAELLADLGRVRQSLAGDAEAGRLMQPFVDLLDRFILKVRMFGFYFASLDVRQDSRKHGEVWAEILEKQKANNNPLFAANYQGWNEEKKINFLLTIRDKINAADFTDDFVRETILSFSAIETIQQQNGEAGCHRYIISNCQSALNVIEVLALARNTMSNTDSIALDIAPLFETIDDLAEAGAIMRRLYSLPQYATHLAHRKNVQHIMLGFSDGTKDGGYLRANWSIFRAKEELTRISREFGIAVIFFDGRGGPPGRGGGNNASYYAAQGPEIENREIHVTIQGQTVSSTYGTQTAARFNIERLFTAGLENHMFQTRAGELREEDKKLLDELADEAYQAYLSLKNSPDFVPYLEKMTPLKWYGDTNIASRPTKRGSDEAMRFEDLRAIPFVGAWAQMKQNIPGFFGFGGAIEVFHHQGKMSDLRRLYRRSLFFRTLVENSMQSLSKSNYNVTAWIEKHPRFGGFWEMLYAEFERTQRQLLDISGQKDLLAENPVSKASILMREQIVLPLIVMQQYALQRFQNESLSNEEAEVYRKIVLRTMFGIINAARNSA